MSQQIRGRLPKSTAPKMKDKVERRDRMPFEAKCSQYKIYRSQDKLKQILKRNQRCPGLARSDRIGAGGRLVDGKGRSKKEEKEVKE